MEIEKTISQLKRERARNSISQDEFRSKVIAQKEKKRAVVEQFRER